MAHETLGFAHTKKSFWNWTSRWFPIRRIGHSETEAGLDTAANVRSALVAMLVAFSLFALFDSKGIRHFARDLPGNAATDIIVDAADRWNGWMQALGLSHVGPAVRDVFDVVRDISW